ncbi:MAG: 5'-nucleotidase, lipoprotein e(P4) family [Calditrichaeota bacterium]|nr:MAG: 5'-nucleotidase, lipoprotein e(P4) family [Calditrichota bacterium]
MGVLVLALLAGAGGCTRTVVVEKPVPAPAPALPQNEHLVMAVLYLQHAAEARALRYQAYALARTRLDEALSHHKSPKKLAVVVDIDETVLDNSPYEGKLIKANASYPEFWKEWCQLAQAKAIPGAVEFLNYAVSRGVDVFYVSNRRLELLEPTMENLRREGFPQVEVGHIYLRTDESSKENRRLAIQKTHEIALLIGDNLADFAAVFEGQSTQLRNQTVDRLKKEFGTRFIVLPNPMYGDWEGALYNYQWRLPADQKALLRHRALKDF